MLLGMDPLFPNDDMQDPPIKIRRPKCRQRNIFDARKNLSEVHGMDALGCGKMSEMQF
jgi:hypothetical protein